jgi:hypothetical protein
MAFKLGDRIRENTTTTGTGDLTLTGADVGFATFNSRLSTNDTTWYALVFGASWEVGIGTFTAPATLTRTTIIASSNSDAALNLGAGTKEVFITVPAQILTQLNQLGGIISRGLGPRHLSGLGLANNASDAVNDIDVAAGAARDDADTGDLVLAATVVKQLDVAFAEYVAPGTPSGGRDSADNLTGAKWFDVYVIGGAGKNAQPFFTTSASPTLPSGFTRKRRIGSVLWMGSFLKSFVQFGERFLFLSPPALDIDATIGASANNYTLSVPRNRRVIALLNLYVYNGSNAAVVYARAPDQSDDGPSQTATPMPSMAAASTGIASGQVDVLTNTSGQIVLRAQNASTLVRASTLGWIDQLH